MTITFDVQTLCTDYLAAWAASDVDAIMERHTPQSMFWLHARAGPVIGRVGVREAFAKLFHKYPGMGMKPTRALYGERHWVLDWTMTWDWQDPGGVSREARCDCLDLVTLDDAGLILRKDTFIDASQVVAAPAPIG